MRASLAAVAVLAVAVRVAAAPGGSALLGLAAGPREAALGGAGVAVADDARALATNPAGLAWNALENLAADRTDLAGISIDHIAYAHPTSHRSTWGVSLGRLAASRIERTEIAPGGGPATGLGTFKAEDVILSTGFAYLLRPDLGVGVSAKAVRERIDGTDGVAVGLDLGARYAWARRGLDLGVAVRNVGGRSALGGSLPFSLHLGASYGRIVRGADFAVLAAEVEVGRDRKVTPRVGLEYWLFGIVALRAGFDERFIDADGGATLGLGVRYRRLALDYSVAPTRDIGNLHRLGISIAFGLERPRPAGEYGRRGGRLSVRGGP